MTSDKMQKIAGLTGCIIGCSESMVKYWADNPVELIRCAKEIQAWSNEIRTILITPDNQTDNAENKQQ